MLWNPRAVAAAVAAAASPLPEAKPAAAPDCTPWAAQAPTLEEAPPLVCRRSHWPKIASIDITAPVARVPKRLRSSAWKLFINMSSPNMRSEELSWCLTTTAAELTFWRLIFHKRLAADSEAAGPQAAADSQAAGSQAAVDSEAAGSQAAADPRAAPESEAATDSQAALGLQAAADSQGANKRRRKQAQPAAPLDRHQQAADSQAAYSQAADSQAAAAEPDLQAEPESQAEHDSHKARLLGRQPSLGGYSSDDTLMLGTCVPISSMDMNAGFDNMMATMQDGAFVSGVVWLACAGLCY